jgi:hypothetical protein
MRIRKARFFKTALGRESIMRPENPDGKQDSRQDGEEAGTLALMALAWTLNDERP